jgi:hypothetical protein
MKITTTDFLELPVASENPKHVFRIDEVLWNLEVRHRIVNLDKLDLVELGLDHGERRFLRQFSHAIIWDTDRVTYHVNEESLRAALEAAAGGARERQDRRR